MGGTLESTNFGIVSGNPCRDQLKEDELPSDSLREVQDAEAISFGSKDKYQELDMICHSGMQTSVYSLTLMFIMVTTQPFVGMTSCF